MGDNPRKNSKQQFEDDFLLFEGDDSDESESDVVEEELPPPSQEIILRLKSNTTINPKKLFIISLHEHRKMSVRKNYFLKFLVI